MMIKGTNYLKRSDSKMIMKLIGGLIIIFSSGLIGILLSNKYGMRPKLLKKFRFSMQLLETEIIYGTTPLPYALQNISVKSEKPWSDFFLEISENILERKFFSMEEAWNDAIKGHLDLPCLNKTDLGLIKSIGKVIGKSDIEDQKKHFNLLYAELSHHEESAENDKKKNERMYRSLGFLLGIAIYIVLI